MKTIAVLAVMAALVVAGVAAAQSESGGSDGKGDGHRPPPGPPMMGLAMKGLTYAELHVKGKEGEEVLRIDQGKIESVGDDSISLTENDESQVTVPVDDGTQVIGRPGEETTLDDLEAGQQVSVTAPEGEAAKAIMVMPKKGDVVAGFGPGGQMPPAPPNAAYGFQRSGN
jgi:hypothetical protein